MTTPSSNVGADASHKSVPEWAYQRADELTRGHEGKGFYRDSFAAYIASHEEAPVDPLLIEAREIAADRARAKDWNVHDHAVRTGQRDDHPDVQIALTALRRGIEIGGAK